jgi:hypothetical protein
MDITESFIYLAALAGTYHYGLNKFLSYVKEKTQNNEDLAFRRYKDFNTNWDDKTSIEHSKKLEKKWLRANFYSRFLTSLVTTVFAILLLSLFILLISALGFHGNPDYQGIDG